MAIHRDKSGHVCECRGKHGHACKHKAASNPKPAKKASTRKRRR